MHVWGASVLIRDRGNHWPSCGTAKRALPLMFVVIAATCFPLCDASAQTVTGNGSRQEVPEDQTHIRLGRIVLTPALTLRSGFDDNIFQSENNPTSDVVSTIAPRITLEGEWQDFRAYVSTGMELGFFARSSDDDYQDADIRITSNIDLDTSTIEGGISWQQNHDPRGGNDVASNAREPVIYQDINTHISGRYVADRLRYESRLSLRRLEFDDSTALDGTAIRNDDRNRTETTETLRALIALDLDREAYGEITLNQRQYDRTPDDTGLTRDSAGFALYGGVRFDLTDLVKADLAAGWMTRTYADPAFGNIGDYTLRGDIDWSVTRLTSLNFNAARAVRETTITGASGILAFDFGMGVSHELRRWLQIGATASYSNEQFQQTTRRDQTGQLGATIEYRMNRFTRLTGAIDHDMQKSNTNGESYRRFQSLISLKLEI